MANYGGFSYTGVQGVNIRTTAGVRFEGDGYAGTLSIRPGLEAGRAWILPNKSGSVPVAGTVAIHLPAVAATTFIYTTALTVTGVRAEDGLAFGLMVAPTYATARILVAAVPSTNTITLTFANIGCAASGEYSLVGTYLHWR